MTKAVVLLALCCGVYEANAASAQQYDYSEMSCAVYLQNDAQAQRDAAIWFTGLYTDIGQAQILDLAAVAEFQGKLTTFCKQQPTFRVATAVEGILGR
jgi:HdeA/HdeB family